MNSKFITLSYRVSGNTPTYGNTPKPKIIEDKSMKKGDSCNTYKMVIHNHSCTHIDAPAHFTKKGEKISEYSIEELIFKKPIIINILKNKNEWIEAEDIRNKKLSGADCVIIRTGFGKFRGDDIYVCDNPGVSPEAIEWIRKNFKKVRCIGIDTISISGFRDRQRGRRTHRAAFEEGEELGDPLLVIEDMNLGVLKNKEKIKKIIVVPWNIIEVDSAPCTVIAEMIDNE